MGIKIYHGNALEVLKDMDSESVDMCMTSPPYWGLRDYQTEPYIWDGTDGCVHEWGAGLFERKRGNASGTSARVGNTIKEVSGIGVDQGNFCIKCNAWKGNLGLEPDYNLFINHLIPIFDEVKRVLKDTGTCWVNLGDSYLGSGQGGGDTGFSKERHSKELLYYKSDAPKRPSQNYSAQAKSLTGIPERFTIAMMDKGGWIRRNTIIWYKPNCMPSSADDRFTVDFEVLYFFTKKQKYSFEQQFEELALNSDVEYRQVLRSNKEYETKDPYKNNFPKTFNTENRNKRCVWKIPTQPYSGAHFATYPEELCYVPIKAGCPKDGTVMDPFMGSGTTLKVARRLGRKGIGIELNLQSIELAKKRINLEQAVFAL